MATGGGLSEERLTPPCAGRSQFQTVPAGPPQGTAEPAAKVAILLGNTSLNTREEEGTKSKRNSFVRTKVRE